MASVEKQLLDSKFNFYLTGSKYFGYESSESDTDYMVQYDGEILDFLEEIGFTHKERLRHRNQNLIDIYVYKPEHLHVQVIEDVARKIYIQKTIKKWLTIEQIHKLFSKDELARRLWDMCLDIADYGHTYDTLGD